MDNGSAIPTQCNISLFLHNNLPPAHLKHGLPYTYFRASRGRVGDICLSSGPYVSAPVPLFIGSDLLLWFYS